MKTTATPPGPTTPPATDAWALARSALGEPASPEADARLMIAFARLALRTPALELGESLDAAHLPDELRDAVAALPDDRITLAERREALENNLEVLVSRGEIDADAWVARLDAWASVTADERWYRTADGNVVSRPAEQKVGRDDPRAWTRFEDERGPAAGLQLPASAAAGDLQPELPVYLAGLHPGVLARIHELSPRNEVGAARRIVIVDNDERHVLDALARSDLRDILADERVTVLLGPDAAASLDAWLDTRLATVVKGIVVKTRPGAPADVGRRLDAAAAAQTARQRELETRAAARASSRDMAWWSRRFEAARRGEDAPLRVLVPSSRFSTYVRHASEDIVGALERRGFDAHLLLEEDDATSMTSLAMLEAIERIDPDLIIAVNYPRTLAHAPDGIPFVCWVQDTMPHLFQPGVGTDQGELDFVVGYLYRAMFDIGGFDRANTLALPAMASERKFYGDPGRIPETRRAAEIAYVSHQSQPPEAMHEKLVASFEAAPALQQICARLRPYLLEIGTRLLSLDPHVDIGAEVRRVMREQFGQTPDEHAASLVQFTYAEPLAERVIRHETIQWAHEIAERRGWRLRLYGRGWDAHPAFADCAAGPLEHNDDLRQAYHASAVQLHMSIHRLSHQRIFECALSGGMPLCRLSGPERMAIERHLLAAAIAAAPMPDHVRAHTRPFGYDVAAHAALRERREFRAALGLETPEVVWVSRAEARSARKRHEPPIGRRLFPNLDYLFTTPAELELAVTRFTDHPEQRERLVRAAADTSRQLVTPDAALDRVLDHVAEGLASGVARERRRTVHTLFGSFECDMALVEATPDVVPTTLHVRRELGDGFLTFEYATSEPDPDYRGLISIWLDDASGSLEGSWMTNTRTAPVTFRGEVTNDTIVLDSTDASSLRVTLSTGADGSIRLRRQTFDANRELDHGIERVWRG